jgi:hypothetical protein
MHAQSYKVLKHNKHGFSQKEGKLNSSIILSKENQVGHSEQHNRREKTPSNKNVAEQHSAFVDVEWHRSNPECLCRICISIHLLLLSVQSETDAKVHSPFFHPSRPFRIGRRRRPRENAGYEPFPAPARAETFSARPAISRVKHPPKSKASARPHAIPSVHPSPRHAGPKPAVD